MSAPSPTPTPLQIGLVLFPKVTQLDFTGPLQVFSSLPGAKIHLIWKRIEPVASDSVLMLTPTTTFADCPQLDVICVPGGFGTDDMINDEEMLAFLRRQAPGAKYITSVCTGSLVLGAAGLLKGYRAATHWTAMDFLSAFGAIPTRTRVCVDRNRVTGGGVTAGIDFALTLVSLLHDQKTAEAIQLRLEYNPAPPFNSGSPDTAPPEVLAIMKDRIAPAQIRRGEMIDRAAARSGIADPPSPHRKRPPGFPDGLSCPTAATHWRAISELLHRGPISQPCPDRWPLLAGTVANWSPAPTRWFPISARCPH